jgi:hypothetical protein
MYAFDNTFAEASQSGGYMPIPITDATNLMAGTAYALFVRGDRTTDFTSNSAAPCETVLQVIGELFKGRFPVTGTVAIKRRRRLSSLLPNPYQAKVDFDGLVKTGLRPDMVVYKPGTKAFETLTSNKIIEPGQSFWRKHLASP